MTTLMSLGSDLLVALARSFVVLGLSGIAGTGLGYGLFIGIRLASRHYGPVGIQTGRAADSSFEETRP